MTCPHVDQLGRDALDDHCLTDHTPAGDDETKTAPEPRVHHHRAGTDHTHHSPQEAGSPMMTRDSDECRLCTVPATGDDGLCDFCREYAGPPITASTLTGPGRTTSQLDQAANLVEAARGDLEAIVRSLDDDAPLLTVADLYAAAAHLRKAGALIDQAAEALEAR